MRVVINKYDILKADIEKYVAERGGEVTKDTIDMFCWLDPHYRLSVRGGDIPEKLRLRRIKMAIKKVSALFGV
jgi:hypothetical protein